MERIAIDLTIPTAAWEEIGDCMREDADRRSRMLAAVYIYGKLHHLDAIEVRQTEDGGLRAANEDFDEHLDGIWNGFDPGDVYEPVTIDGRTYLLFMDPGC
jgi:hypothetical protein